MGQAGSAQATVATLSAVDDPPQSAEDLQTWTAAVEAEYHKLRRVHLVPGVEPVCNGGSAAAATRKRMLPEEDEVGTGIEARLEPKAAENDHPNARWQRSTQNDDGRQGRRPDGSVGAAPPGTALQSMMNEDESSPAPGDIYPLEAALTALYDSVDSSSLQIKDALLAAEFHHAHEAVVDVGDGDFTARELGRPDASSSGVPPPPALPSSSAPRPAVPPSHSLVSSVAPLVTASAPLVAGSTSSSNSSWENVPAAQALGCRLPARPSTMRVSSSADGPPHGVFDPTAPERPMPPGGELSESTIGLRGGHAAASVGSKVLPPLAPPYEPLPPSAAAPFMASSSLPQSSALPGAAGHGGAAAHGGAAGHGAAPLGAAPHGHQLVCVHTYPHGSEHLHSGGHQASYGGAGHEPPSYLSPDVHDVWASPEDMNARELTRKAWLAEEDELILSQVDTMGFRWRVIAAMLPGRSDDAVRNRWNRLQEAWRDGVSGAVPADRPKAGYKCTKCGKPKKNHVCDFQSGSMLAPAAGPAGPTRARDRMPPAMAAEGEKLRVSWTRHEDDMIRMSVSRMGPRWATIAAELPGRTEHAVRNRWHRLQERQLEQNALPQAEQVGAD